MPRRATLDRIASTILVAFSPESSRSAVPAASIRASLRIRLRLTEPDGWVVAGYDHGGLQIANPLYVDARHRAPEPTLRFLRADLSAPTAASRERTPCSRPASSSRCTQTPPRRR